MKQTVAVILAAALPAFAGCTPYGTSLHPLATDEDVADGVSDAAVQGEWTSVRLDEDDDSVIPRWKIERDQGSRPFYRVNVTVPSVDRTREATFLYVGRLVRLNEQLFIDAEFWKQVDGRASLEWSELPGIVPVHLLGRLWIGDNYLRLAPFRAGWIAATAPAASVMSFEMYRGIELSLTTLPTHELRQIIADHTDDPWAYEDPTYLCRPGTDCVTVAHEDALRRAPDDVNEIHQAATFFHDKGNYHRAVELRRRLVSLNTKDAKFHEQLADSLLFEHDFRGAREQFTIAKTLSATALERCTLARDIAFAHYLEGDFASAVKAYDDCFSGQAVNTAEPIVMGSVLLRRLGRDDEARQLLTSQSQRFIGQESDALLLDLVLGRLSQSAWNSDCLDVASRPLVRLVRGQQFLLEGKPTQAAAEFKALVDGGKPGSHIALAARIELERLTPSSR